MLYKDQNGRIYVQEECSVCGHSYIHRKDTQKKCPLCSKPKRRSKFDLTDPAIARTYSSYYAMLSRCTNTKHKDFPNYGGRGVCVQPEWLESFDNFLADMGLRPEGTSLDRKDFNGHYVKENCAWHSQSIQNRFKRHVFEGKLSRILKPQAKKFELS